MPKISPVSNATRDPVSPPTTKVVKAMTTSMPLSAIKPEGQPAKVEDTAPEATQPIDPKFEALAKKESALRTREKEIQSQEAKFETRIQEAVSKALGEYKGRLKAQSLEVLNEEGITYDDLVQKAINAPDANTLEIRNELKALREAQQKMEESAKNSVTQQREAAVNQIRHDVVDLVKNDASFETIQATESAEDVVELITRTYDETGKLLTVDEAARMVEEELFQEAMKIAQLGKVKAKLTPEPQETKQELKSQRQIQTLTNNMTTSKPMSARERAIKVFNEGKK